MDTERDVGELLVDYQRLCVEAEAVRTCRGLIAPDGVDTNGGGSLSAALLMRLDEIEAEREAVASRLRADHGISDPDAAFDSSRLAVRRSIEGAMASRLLHAAEEDLENAADVWTRAIRTIEMELEATLDERELKWLRVELRSLQGRLLRAVGPGLG